ncbi:DUF6629 family protein [Pedobacter sp. P351]|uniref:DUF6629 family protein n=1 Tax=Pedobacter superstes TaxID=3133441 RepID=UPI0030A45160
MCFSASASFIASTALFGGGVASIKQTSRAAQVPFAVIPLMFSIQQLSEGFVWLSLTNSDYSAFEKPSTYVFMFFAQVIWPSLVPLSIYFLEENPLRKKILLILLGIGAAVSIYVTYSLLFYSVKASISSHHIVYYSYFPHQKGLVASVVYLLPTVVPPFISGIKKMNVLGMIIIISLVVTKLFFSRYLVSVWCYFAAIISLIVFYIIKELRANYFRSLKVSL